MMAERKYYTAQREHLAKEWFDLLFRRFLERILAVSLTDRDLMRWILCKMNTEKGVPSQCVRLSEFDFSVEHCTSVKGR